jgi:hypothetical protein
MSADAKHLKEPFSLREDEVDEFVTHYFPKCSKVLFVGNIGFSPDVLYFPNLMRNMLNIDFRFMEETRPSVPEPINSMATTRQSQLSSMLATRVSFAKVEILAKDDGAAVAGRRACAQVDNWLQEADYSDIIIDATGLSRGTCFPIAKHLHQYATAKGKCVHLLIADGSMPGNVVRPISNDRADWMHGFQGEAELDESADALKLWVVQLTEDRGNSLRVLYKELNANLKPPPEEVCPIVPFPADTPRRGDDLVFELRNYWADEWAETPLSFIYAHESDPTDVYRSIVRLHNGRKEALAGLNMPSMTILSPIGRRLPGVGLLLAALEYDLPMFYLETVGYELLSSLPPANEGPPKHRWHFRLNKNASGT